MKGRGAQKNIANKFLKNETAIIHHEGIDDYEDIHPKTVFKKEFPKKIINKVDSPDLPLEWSMNPYQGCEHGCIYCYARPTHEYWGLNGALDFERIILVKENAPELLAQTFDHKSWKPAPIMFAGNTDIYQPAERKFLLTRKMLDVLFLYKNPVGMITKNHLVLRDLDLLQPMAELNLVTVSMSVTSLQEEVRQKLEPRTSSVLQRLKAIESLSHAGIPVHVMIAPVIPGLTDHEIPAILQAVRNAGAVSVAYQLVRLNGMVAPLFEDWVSKAFPDRANKIVDQIKETHGGQLNDSRFETRKSGEGKIAQAIQQLYKMNKQKLFKDLQLPKLETKHFKRPDKGQLSLF